MLIRAHQRSSEPTKAAHPTWYSRIGSVLISAHQGSSVLIRAHQGSSRTRRVQSHRISEHRARVPQKRVQHVSVGNDR